MREKLHSEALRGGGAEGFVESVMLIPLVILGFFVTKELDRFISPPFWEYQQRDDHDRIIPRHFMQGAQQGGLHPVKVCKGMNVPLVLKLQGVVSRPW